MLLISDSGSQAISKSIEILPTSVPDGATTPTNRSGDPVPTGSEQNNKQFSEFLEQGASQNPHKETSAETPKPVLTTEPQSGNKQQLDGTGLPLSEMASEQMLLALSTKNASHKEIEQIDKAPVAVIDQNLVQPIESNPEIVEVASLPQFEAQVQTTDHGQVADPAVIPPTGPEVSIPVQPIEQQGAGDNTARHLVDAEEQNPAPQLDLELDLELAEVADFATAQVPPEALAATAPSQTIPTNEVESVESTESDSDQLTAQVRESVPQELPDLEQSAPFSVLNQTQVIAKDLPATDFLDRQKAQTLASRANRPAVQTFAGQVDSGFNAETRPNSQQPAKQFNQVQMQMRNTTEFTPMPTAQLNEGQPLIKSDASLSADLPAALHQASTNPAGGSSSSAAPMPSITDSSALSRATFSSALGTGIDSGVRTAITDPAWGSEVTGRIALMASGSIQKAQIELLPAELGRLDILLSTEGDQTRVSFVVQNQAAREALEAQMPRLREALEEIGLGLAEGEVADQSQGQSKNWVGDSFTFDGQASTSEEDAEESSFNPKVNQLNISTTKGGVDAYA